MVSRRLLRRGAAGVAVDLFEGIPDVLEAGRYHSWVISEEGFPSELEVTARDANNYIMALRHTRLDVQGVQFHPESILTANGLEMFRNFTHRVAEQHRVSA